MKIKQEIPIFFSIDDNYVPCLSVALTSLIENSNPKTNYRVIILNIGISEKSKKEIKKFETKNVKVSFEDVSERIENIQGQLAYRLRDYYSTTIYFRMFIPSMFPEYEKAIYIDSDVVIADDIEKLYSINMKKDLLVGVRDEVVYGDEAFRVYARIALGIEPEKYFNSGMLLMNLREMRKACIEEKFLYMLTKYNLDTIAPDQDYLNILCRDRVTFIDESWNKMPDFGNRIAEEDIHIVHYNMYRKPWHYAEVPYSDLFWKYAQKTKYYEQLKNDLENYSQEQKDEDKLKHKKLIEQAKRITKEDLKFKDIIGETEEQFEGNDGTESIFELFNELI